jgi:hypothetical protein
LYSLGATKEKIEWHFNNNTGYQRDQPETAAELSDSLSDISNFKRHLGDPKEYRNFLLFFRREMERDGYEKAVNRFLFGGDALSNEIFARLFTGSYTPRPSVLNKLIMGQVSFTPSSTRALALSLTFLFLFVRVSPWHARRMMSMWSGS